MTVVEYDQLSAEQREWMINGCGPGALSFLVPDLIFRDACNRHDFDYWRGFTDWHRQDADWRFLQNMLAACDALPWWKRWAYKAAAWRYWAAVRLFGNRRIFGKTPFHYRSGFATWDELRLEMGLGTRVESERKMAAAHRLKWVP